MSLSEPAKRFNSFAYRLLYQPWPNPTIPRTSESVMRALPDSSPPRHHFDSIPNFLVATVLHDCGESAAATIAELRHAGMWVESQTRSWREGNWVIEGGRKFRIYRAVPYSYLTGTDAESAEAPVLHLAIYDARTFWNDSHAIEPLHVRRPFYDLTPLGRDEAATRFRPPLLDERVEFCGRLAAAIVESLRRSGDESIEESLGCIKAPLAELLHSASIASDFDPHIGKPLAAIRDVVKLTDPANWSAFRVAVSNDCSARDAAKGLDIPAARDSARWQKLTANLRSIARIAAAPSGAAAESGISDPVSIVWLRTVVPTSKVRGDASKLAAWLQRQSVPIHKRAGKNCAERAALLGVFRAGSEIHRLLTDRADDRR